MTTQATALKRLAKLSEICLALPGAIREDKGNYSTFLVAKKIFAYFLNEADAADCLVCKLPPGKGLDWGQRNRR